MERNEELDPEAQVRAHLLNLLSFLSEHIGPEDLREPQLSEAKDLVRQFLTPMNDEKTRKAMIQVHNSLYPTQPK